MLDAAEGGALAAAIGVPLAMAGLAKLFPARPLPAVGISPEELKARYQKWELGLSLAALASVVPLGFLVWLALRGVSAVHASLLPASDVLWVAGGSYWAIPAMFLGLTLALPVFTWVSRALLRERYPEYLAYQQVKSGMDVARVARLLFGFVGIGCAVLVFLGLDWSVRVGPDGLAVNRLLGVGEERHAFAEVRAVRTAPAVIAPNGNVVSRREFAVRFADGSLWSTNDLISDTPPEEKQRLAALLSDRSGVRIEEVRVLRNDEL